MQSDSIVIAFDVTEDFRAGIFDRFKDAVLDQFRLEPGKEALGLGIIITMRLYGSLIGEIRRCKADGDIRPPRIDCPDRYE